MSSKIQDKFPKIAKVGAIIITIFLIGLMWFTIIGSFLLSLNEYWSYGGSFSNWDIWQIFFGILILLLSFILLCYCSLFLFKRLYIKNLEFISQEIQRSKQRDLLNENREKFNKLKRKYLKLKNLLVEYLSKDEVDETDKADEGVDV